MQLLRFCRTHRFPLSLTAVFLLPWLAFSRSLFQGFAPIDDAFLIVNNPIVHGFDFTHWKLAFTNFDPELYIPFTFLSFQIDWLLGGGDAFIFHVTNILLQGMNAVLVGLLIRKFLVGKRGANACALLAAAIFAIHPLQSEAVVWAAGRKDLLSTFFFLLSFLCFLRSERPRTFFALSIAFFICALLSKVLTATLPAVLLLYFLLCKDKKFLKGTILKLVPFFALSCLFLVIAAFGKERILTSSTLLETFLMAQKSVLFYLQKLLFPVGLTVIYPFQKAIAISDPEFFLPLLVNLGLLTIAFRERKKRPLLSFGILFYFLTLLPTFFNFHKGELLFFAVDRYAYIPSIGFLLVLVSLVAELREWLGLSPRVIFVTCATLLLVSAGLSMHQTRYWDSPDSLFGHSIDLYPESASARMALGSILRDRNQLEEAFAVLRDGARYSDHPGLNIEAGLVYSAAGQTQDAREQFRMALAKNPHLAPAYFYLGFLDEHDGFTDLAVEKYEQAIDEDPSYVTVRVHLARLLMKQKKFDEASLQLAEAIKWNPVSAEAVDALIDLAKLQKNAESLGKWESWKKTLDLQE